MEKNMGYEIQRSVLFDNGRGFALGHDPAAPAPFVTWQFTQEQGQEQRDYYWGHYHGDEGAAISDYNNRVYSYEQQYGVRKVENRGPDFYTYYSTQRPVDIGTFPQKKDNLPVGILNYGERRAVEGGAFRAWGELIYEKPLTEQEAAAYELRPAPDNPDRWKATPEKESITAKLREGSTEHRAATEHTRPRHTHGDR